MVTEKGIVKMMETQHDEIYPYKEYETELHHSNGDINRPSNHPGCCLALHFPFYVNYQLWNGIV
jgi:hypothetical protein